MHLKDIRIVDGDTDSFIKWPVCTTLEMGNLDIPAIIEAAEAAGCKWYAVETCTDWIDNDSARCAKEGYEYLGKNFCE